MRNIDRYPAKGIVNVFLNTLVVPYNINENIRPRIKNRTNALKLNNGVIPKRKIKSPKPIDLSIGLVNSLAFNEKYNIKPIVFIKIKATLYKIELKFKSIEK